MDWGFTGKGGVGMKNRRQTTKTVSIDIERAEKANAVRLEKIAQLQSEIDDENAKIKELRKLHSTLYRSEFKEKIARGLGDRQLTDDEMTQLIEMTRQFVDNLDSSKVNALDGGNTAKIEPPLVSLSKPYKSEKADEMPSFTEVTETEAEEVTVSPDDVPAEDE